MAQKSHLTHLPEFQSNLFLHPFISDILLFHPFQSFHFCRITFSYEDGLPFTNPTPVTVLFHTGRTDFLFEAPLIFLPEILSIQPCFDKRPWEDIFKFSYFGMGIHFQSCLLKTFFPQGEVKLIAPTIETASQSIGLH